MSAIESIFGRALRPFFPPMRAILFYPYRLAWVTSYWLRLSRDITLVRLIEAYLAWSAGVNRDNHTVYRLNNIIAENDEADRYRSLYIGFSDSWMYIGDQVRLEHELCQGCDVLGRKNICTDRKCYYYSFPANVQARAKEGIWQ